MEFNLGLGQAPITRTIYCNATYQSWYFWNGDKQEPILIEEPAVTGYARELRIEKGEYKGKPTFTLLLTLDCGFQWYQLSCGAQSNFAKSLILAIAAIPCAHLRERTVTVSPRPGEDPKVLFASVWSGRTIIKTQWPEDPSLFKLHLHMAKGNVAEANMPERPMPSQPKSNGNGARPKPPVKRTNVSYSPSQSPEAQRVAAAVEAPDEGDYNPAFPPGDSGEYRFEAIACNDDDF